MPPDESYRQVMQKIRAVCKRCGRDPAEVSLVAVTKGFSLDHVMPAYSAGCRDFGESRVQEALEKIQEGPKDISWHLIGTLQKNKVNKVVGKFVLIHSVDSFELAQKISESSEKEGVKTQILLQVNTSYEKTKHGVSAKEVLGSIDDLSKMPGINIQGLMTMAPFVEDEKLIRKCFIDLRKLRDQLREQYPGIKELSMGMTHDFAIAIEEGATLLRVGTAIFRPLK